MLPSRPHCTGRLHGHHSSHSSRHYYSLPVIHTHPDPFVRNHANKVCHYCVHQPDGVRAAVHMAEGRVVAAGALLLRLPARAGPQVWWRPRLPVLPWAVVSAPRGRTGWSGPRARHCAVPSPSLRTLSGRVGPQGVEAPSPPLLLLPVPPAPPTLSFSVTLHLAVCLFFFCCCLLPLPLSFLYLSLLRSNCS